MHGPLTAADLYAVALGQENAGEEQCHWCGARCPRLWYHDDHRPIPFHKSTVLRARPGNPYICRGCWLFRRKRVTVQWLSGGFRDGQCAMDHSWWITADSCHAIQKHERPHLYQHLLNPPTHCCLALLDGPGEQNHLQRMVANYLPGVDGSTGIGYTVNGVIYTYSVYELEQAIRHSRLSLAEDEQHRGEGKLPGVRALLTLLGPPPADMVLNQEDPKRGRGRPVQRREDMDGRSAKKLVRRSG